MLYGKRIRLRGNERSDLPKFIEWLNDPEVRRYLAMSMPISQATEEQWFENMLKRPPEEQSLGIEIKDRDAWHLIGNCETFDINWRTRSAEVGLFIGEKSCWNLGYGTEVMRLLLHHGFGTLNLNRIFLHVDAENLGGIRAYEKAGFIHEARLRESDYREGRYCDDLIMSVLRSEWTPEE
ncbi:MAG: GNAT family protein [Chloroflexi bacterium]|nr:GNAT family protein [Chloroflexota bacterium]